MRSTAARGSAENESGLAASSDVSAVITNEFWNDSIDLRPNVDRAARSDQSDALVGNEQPTPQCDETRTNGLAEVAVEQSTSLVGLPATTDVLVDRLMRESVMKRICRALVGGGLTVQASQETYCLKRFLQICGQLLQANVQEREQNNGFTLFRAESEHADLQTAEGIISVLSEKLMIRPDDFRADPVIGEHELRAKLGAPGDKIKHAADLIKEFRSSWLEASIHYVVDERNGNLYGSVRPKGSPEVLVSMSTQVGALTGLDVAEFGGEMIRSTIPDGVHWFGGPSDYGDITWFDVYRAVEIFRNANRLTYRRQHARLVARAAHPEPNIKVEVVEKISNTHERIDTGPSRPGFFRLVSSRRSEDGWGTASPEQVRLAMRIADLPYDRELDANAFYDSMISRIVGSAGVEILALADVYKPYHRGGLEFRTGIVKELAKEKLRRVELKVREDQNVSCSVDVDHISDGRLVITGVDRKLEHFVMLVLTVIPAVAVALLAIDGRNSSADLYQSFLATLLGVTWAGFEILNRTRMGGISLRELVTNRIIVQSRQEYLDKVNEALEEELIGRFGDVLRDYTAGKYSCVNQRGVEGLIELRRPLTLAEAGLDYLGCSVSSHGAVLVRLGSKVLALELQTGNASHLRPVEVGEIPIAETEGMIDLDGRIVVGLTEVAALRCSGEG